MLAYRSRLRCLTSAAVIPNLLHHSMHSMLRPKLRHHRQVRICWPPRFQCPYHLRTNYTLLNLPAHVHALLLPEVHLKTSIPSKHSPSAQKVRTKKSAALFTNPPARPTAQRVSNATVHVSGAGPKPPLLLLLPLLRVQRPAALRHKDRDLARGLRPGLLRCQRQP